MRTNFIQPILVFQSPNRRIFDAQMYSGVFYIKKKCPCHKAIVQNADMLRLKKRKEHIRIIPKSE